MIFQFFFFKQKTAYEMRISDWSSDVCSSDLHAREPAQPASGLSDRAGRPERPDGEEPRGRDGGAEGAARLAPHPPGRASCAVLRERLDLADPGVRRAGPAPVAATARDRRRPARQHALPPPGPAAARGGHPAGRSEEHTSELQSLMRITYAVFCLKQKKQHIHSSRNTARLRTLCTAQ